MKVAINFDGLKLYSSNGLKHRFINAMYKTARSKPIARTIEKMVYNNSLTPTFTNKNLFSYVGKKLMPGVDEDSMTSLGIYFPEKKIIVICMEPNISWGFADNNLLARWVIHEGMHKFANESFSSFYSINKKSLEDYYSAVFFRLFSLKDKKVKNIDKIVKFLCQNEHSTNCFRNSGILKEYKTLEKYLKNQSTLNNEMFISILKNYIIYWKMFSRDPSVLKSNINSFMNIFSALGHAYKDVWGKTITQNFFGQEIAIPSEVIAVKSEIKTDSLIYKAFSKLK